MKLINHLKDTLRLSCTDIETYLAYWLNREERGHTIIINPGEAYTSIVEATGGKPKRLFASLRIDPKLEYTNYQDFPRVVANELAETFAKRMLATPAPDGIYVMWEPLEATIAETTKDIIIITFSLKAYVR